MLPTKFGVNWPFGSWEGAKNRFSRCQAWQLSWIFDQNDFSDFDQQVTPMLLIKFQDNWRRSETFSRFSRWSPWRPPWISHRNKFSYFLTPMLLTKFQANLPFVSAGEGKKDFQDCGDCSRLGFPIRMILAFFDLQHADAYYQVSKQLAFHFRKRSEK